jgi:hypothetical protein
MKITLGRAPVLQVAFGLLLVLASSCHAEKASPKSTPPAGTIALVRAPKGVNDRGDLVLVTLANGAQRDVASQVSAHESMSVSAEGDRILVVRVLESLKVVRTAIVQVLIATGEVQQVAEGHGPALSGDGTLAYCDQGRLILRSARPDAGETSIGQLYSTTGCGIHSWSPGGDLAFDALSPLGAKLPAPESLYVRSGNGTLREISLGEDGAVGRDMSWSAARDQVAFAVVNDRVEVRRVSTGETTLTVPGGQVKFDPKENGRLAVIERRQDDDLTTIRVYRGGQVVAQHELDRPLGPGFDWSPGGGQLVIALDSSIAIWNPQTDEFRRIDVADAGQQVFEQVKWLP